MLLVVLLLELRPVTIWAFSKVSFTKCLLNAMPHLCTCTYVQGCVNTSKLFPLLRLLQVWLLGFHIPPCNEHNIIFQCFMP